MLKTKRGAARIGAGIMALGVLAGAAWAEGVSGQKAHDHSHGHDHGHDHAHDPAHRQGSADIRRGIFDDAQVAARPLSDWEGEWQSVYPYLQDGTLDPVWTKKAAAGDKGAEAYRAEYEIGYKTDVTRITIKGPEVTFHRGGEQARGIYAEDGYEILTYPKGNRGVRFIFKKTEGDAAAPSYIQFSDHEIFPVKVGHYHLYWGNDRAALLEELTNWPTYYPSALSAQEILAEMLAH